MYSFSANQLCYESNVNKNFEKRNVRICVLWRRVAHLCPCMCSNQHSRISRTKKSVSVRVCGGFSRAAKPSSSLPIVPSFMFRVGRRPLALRIAATRMLTAVHLGSEHNNQIPVLSKQMLIGIIGLSRNFVMRLQGWKWDYINKDHWIMLLLLSQMPYPQRCLFGNTCCLFWQSKYISTAEIAAHVNTFIGHNTQKCRFLQHSSPVWLEPTTN